MKNENKAQALNKRLLAEVITDVRPKMECPEDLALLLARFEAKAQYKMRAAAELDEAVEKSMQSMPDSERGKVQEAFKEPRVSRRP